MEVARKMNLNESRRLIVFPGSGNPDVSPVYAKVYDLIKKLALKCGYTHVDCNLRWPGQFKPDCLNQGAVQRLDTSVQNALDYIQIIDGAPYDILARSYGCWVALSMLLSQRDSIRYPDKVVLWGPVPFWVVWEMTVRDYSETKDIMLTKGSNIDQTFFQHLKPIESMLRYIRIPTRIASGSEDNYCPPSFVDYLKSVTRENPSVQYASVVQGAPHEVTENLDASVVKEYMRALWGAL